MDSKNTNEELVERYANLIDATFDTEFFVTDSNYHYCDAAGIDWKREAEEAGDGIVFPPGPIELQADGIDLSFAVARGEDHNYQFFALLHVPEGHPMTILTEDDGSPSIYKRAEGKFIFTGLLGENDDLPDWVVLNRDEVITLIEGKINEGSNRELQTKHP